MKKLFCIAVLTLFLGLTHAAYAGEAGPEAGRKTDTLNGSQAAGHISGKEAGADTKKDPKEIIVARVNGNPITMRSLVNLMNTLNARKSGEGLPQAKDSLRKEALDRLIFEELAYQKAIADGSNAAQADIDKSLEDLKIKTGSDEKFRAFLEKNGVTEEELRSEIARNLVLRQVFQKEIFDRAAITVSDIERAYEKGKDKFLRAEKAVVVDIVFFMDPAKDESFRKAEKVLKEIQEDKDKNPWNLVPDGTFIVHQTELSSSRQPELLARAVKLEAGEFTGVIAAGDSLHILQLKEYTPEKQSSFDEVKGFLKLEVLAEARKKRMHEWEAELRKGATIEIVDGDGKKLR